MARSCGFCLSVLFSLVPHLALAQTAPISIITSASIRAALAGEVFSPSQVADATGWPRVKAIPFGTNVHVSTDARTDASRMFVAATDTLLVTLRPNVLPKEAQDVILQVLLHNEDSVTALIDGPGFATDVMSVSADGVIFRHEKVAETGEVFERVDRANVRAVKGRAYRTNSTWPTVSGAVIGGVVGFLFAGGIANSEIPAGAAKRDIFLSLVGMPVAGGFIGAWLSRHDEQTVYYSAEK